MLPRRYASVLALLTCTAGCSATPPDATFESDPGAGSPGGTAAGGTAAGGADDGDLGLSSGGGPDGSPCPGDHTSLDEDGDGWTGGDGDCNDCEALTNPGAQDRSGNGADEDCSGAADDELAVCDDNLPLDSADPMDGARALGLCKKATAEGWGVVSAEYVTSSGGPLPDPKGHGILDGFGPMIHPQEGSRLLALSSGTARQPKDAGFESPAGYDKGYTSASPPGYPKETPACPGVLSGQPHDSAALRLSIRTPTNAKSLRFQLDFYTFEFPEYICSEYNDYFVAMLSPKGDAQADGNISFDAQGNNISVNAGFLAACEPQVAGGKHFDCPLGPAPLMGTGFDFHGATGWLQTSTALSDPGGVITLDLAVWDSGDGLLDSTVLLDAFAFEVEETPTVTEPVDVPK